MNNHMLLIAGIIGVVVLIGTVVYFARCDAACEADSLRNGTANFSHVSAQVFKEQLPGGVVIDVRTPEEYVTGHIVGSMLIDVNALDFKDRIGQLDRTVPYYVYCRSGARSSVAVDVMKTAGFEKVYGLEGGINSWRKSGFVLE